MKSTIGPIGAIDLQHVNFVIVQHAREGLVDAGYLGVDIFFVVSGFLITGLLVREREGLYRVQVGPYANAGEARQAADRIALALGVKPVVAR